MISNALKSIIFQYCISTFNLTISHIKQLYIHILLSPFTLAPQCFWVDTPFCVVQDPKLLAEILAKTGQDLRVSRGRRRGSGPGLVPIHAATSRQRLSNKLFCGRTVRRLAAALNQLDARRHGDKFADQFNYHFNR